MPFSLSSHLTSSYLPDTPAVLTTESLIPLGNSYWLCTSLTWWFFYQLFISLFLQKLLSVVFMSVTFLGTVCSFFQGLLSGGLRTFTPHYDGWPGSIIPEKLVLLLIPDFLNAQFSMIFFFFFFLRSAGQQARGMEWGKDLPCSMWDLSSLTRDQTPAPCGGCVES